jgi:hypothetical protein
MYWYVLVCTGMYWYIPLGIDTMCCQSSPTTRSHGPCVKYFVPFRNSIWPFHQSSLEDFSAGDQAGRQPSAANLAAHIQEFSNYGLRGRPDGRLLAQAPAGLAAPSPHFHSHFKFCAGAAGRPLRHMAPFCFLSSPKARTLPDRLPVPVAHSCSESTAPAFVCSLRACPPLPAPLLSAPKPSTNRRCAFVCCIPTV